MKLAFVCVQNAGRSQVATAFASQECTDHSLTDVEIVTGGTHPAEQVHQEVLDTMQELDVDISDRAPRGISTEELESCDLVITMGCSTLELDAETDVRDWALPDPDGKPPERVREIRDLIRERVSTLFDELDSK